MARLKTIEVTPADASLTGFASNVTGASFTLTANDSGDNLAHRVSIRNDSGTDHSSKTVTLVGTDADGESLTEVVTGPGVSATVESTGYFLTLVSATPSATIGADTFDIGWVDEVSTNTIPLDFYASTAATVLIDVTGTISYSVEQSFGDILATAAPSQNAVWFSVGSPAAVDATADLSIHATGTILLVNSYSSGASLKYTIVQNGSGVG